MLFIKRYKGLLTKSGMSIQVEVGMCHSLDGRILGRIFAFNGNVTTLSKNTSALKILRNRIALRNSPS